MLGCLVSVKISITAAQVETIIHILIITTGIMSGYAIGRLLLEETAINESFVWFIAGSIASGQSVALKFARIAFNNKSPAILVVCCAIASFSVVIGIIVVFCLVKPYLVAFGRIITGYLTDFFEIFDKLMNKFA